MDEVTGSSPVTPTSFYMNCFYHSDRPAAGICKACNRGVCVECATDVGAGLACKGKCEERVVEVDKLITLNLKSRSSAKGQSRQTAIFMAVIGALFAALGGLMIWHLHTSDGYIFILIGLVYALFGVVRYLRVARLLKSEK
jgi:hypothetical protein